MMDAVIKLINITTTQDENGVLRNIETSRSVFCQWQSVTRAEFFEGGRTGLNPELVFTIFHADYDEETILEYNGKRYAIYRVYNGGDDYIELYAQREGGTNRGAE